MIDKTPQSLTIIGWSECEVNVQLQPIVASRIPARYVKLGTKRITAVSDSVPRVAGRVPLRVVGELSPTARLLRRHLVGFGWRAVIGHTHLVHLQ